MYLMETHHPCTRELGLQKLKLLGYSRISSYISFRHSSRHHGYASLLLELSFSTIFTG